MQVCRACAICTFIDFGWDRLNILHCNLYGAMFWICNENSVHNIPCFSYCRAVLAQHQSLFFFPPILCTPMSGRKGGSQQLCGCLAVSPGQLTKMPDCVKPSTNFTHVFKSGCLCLSSKTATLSGIERCYWACVNGTCNSQPYSAKWLPGKFVLRCFHVVDWPVFLQIFLLAPLEEGYDICLSQSSETFLWLLSKVMEILQWQQPAVPTRLHAPHPVLYVQLA